MSNEKRKCLSHELQFLVFTSPQEGRNGVYSGKGARGVMLQGGDIYEGQSALSPYPVDCLQYGGCALVESALDWPQSNPYDGKYKSTTGEILTCGSKSNFTLFDSFTAQGSIGAGR
jgi:hypothetical protein